MKTDLTYIDEAIEAVIVDEETGRRKSVDKTPMQPVSLRGFDMPDELIRPEHEATITKKRQTVISRYRTNASALRVDLMKAGINPIAVLPQKAWASICKESGLYRMEPDDNGQVQVDPNNIVNRLRHKGRWQDYVIGWGVFLLLCFTTLFLVGYFGWMAEDFRTAFIFGMTITLTALFGTFSRYQMEAPRFRRNVARYLQGKTWSQILADLAPQGTLYSGVSYVNVRLPKPPLEIARLIMLVHKTDLELRVAAEPGAIHIEGGVQKMFENTYDDMIRQEEMARRDPILYVVKRDGTFNEEDQHAVAIIAQYGEFPIEREVIDRLVAMGTVV